MIRLQDFSVTVKFNSIILGMLLVNLVVGAIIAQTAFQLVQDQIEKRGADLAAYIAVLSSNDILLEDRYALADRINKTKQNSEDVRYIIIADSTGRILAHTFTEFFPQGLTANLSLGNAGADDFQNREGLLRYSVRQYDSNEGSIREVLLPIEGGTIGYIRVGLSENITHQLMNKRVREVGLIVVLAWIAAAAAATYLAYLFIAPLKRLTQAAEQIQRGNYQVETADGGQDELGKLSGVFNAMVKGLRSKHEENEHLLEELRAKEALRAELIMKLFSVQEEERKRISRELHDETGQLLASLLAYMKLLLSKLTTEEQRRLHYNARDVATTALTGLRKIAVELRPPILDDLGLQAAMQRLVQNFGDQQGIEVHFSAPSAYLNLGSEISLTLYRILQESLTNIAKHAGASCVKVSLLLSSDDIQLIVCDNGIGLQNIPLDIASQRSRLGIYGMSERAELLGGNLMIDSGSDGTTVRVNLPRKLR